MNKQELIDLISKNRSQYQTEIDEKKCIRFRDDRRVINWLILEQFVDEGLPRRPTEEEFLDRVDITFLLQKIPLALKAMAELDYHYSNLEKWT